MAVSWWWLWVAMSAAPCTKHYKGPTFSKRGITHDWAGYADEVRYDIDIVKQMGDIEPPVH